MKESLWGYWLTLLGIIVATVMILLQNYTTSDQQDYYLAREITYAAMYDAIDYGYYKKNGELKIIKEKFVENFIRRFAESTTLNKDYKINFYSIYETPPAVSVEIKTSTGKFLVGESGLDATVTTRLTAILETGLGETELEDYSVTRKYYSLPYQRCDSGTCTWNNYGSPVIEIDLDEDSGVLRELKEKVGESFDINNVTYSINNLKTFEDKNDYTRYKNFICGDVSTECLDNSTDVSKLWTTGVPHSLLHNMGDDIRNYFADGTNISLNQTIDTDAKKLKVFASTNFSCDETIDDDIDVFEFRKNLEASMIIDNTDKLNYGLGYLNLYDYTYRNGSEYYSDYKIDGTYEGTPYYKACLIGFEFDITFSYGDWWN